MYFVIKNYRKRQKTNKRIHSMEDIIFNQIDMSYSIMTEKEYEKATGKKLKPALEKEEKTNKKTRPKKVSGQVEIQQKDNLELPTTSTILTAPKSKQESKTIKNGIGVIQVAPIKSSNTFLNIVQTKEQKERQEETKRVKESDIEFPYKRTELLTNAEKQLYYFMRNYLDKKESIVIFPKVRLADIIDVDTKITLNRKPFYKISSKHVDFLICDYNTLDIICVVELDDYTHDTEENRQRDLFVMEALYNVGIQVFRIKVPIRTISKQDLELIDEKINTVLAPLCPHCGIKMIPKKSIKSGNIGHRFYSCPNFMNKKDKCRYTINIDTQGEELP